MSKEGMSLSSCLNQLKAQLFYCPDFQSLPKIDVIPEPVDKWTNLNGTDLLDLLFKDPKRWALAQVKEFKLLFLIT